MQNGTSRSFSSTSALSECAQQLGELVAFYDLAEDLTHPPLTRDGWAAYHAGVALLADAHEMAMAAAKGRRTPHVVQELVDAADGVLSKYDRTERLLPVSARLFELEQAEAAAAEADDAPIYVVAESWAVA